MEVSMILELAEKVKRVNHRLKNQGNQSLLQLGIRTHRRIRRARSFERAKFIGDEFYSDLKKKLSTFVTIGIAGGIAMGISKAAPIINSDGYESDTGTEIDMHEELSVSEPSISQSNELNESSAETSIQHDEVTEQQFVNSTNDQSITDQNFSNQVNEEEENPEEISVTADEVTEQQFVNSTNDLSVIDQNLLNQVNEMEENPEESSIPVGEIVEQPIIDSNTDQEIISEEHSIPNTAIVEQEVVASNYDLPIDDQNSLNQPGNQEENPEETSIPIGEHVSEQPETPIADELINGQNPEQQANESLNSPATEFPTTAVTENESEVIKEPLAEVSTNTPVSDSPESPVVSTGDADLLTPSEQSENAPHQIEVFKTYLGLAANPDNYDRETAKTLLHELELSKRASSGLDENMVKDLDKKIELLGKSIDNIQKPFTLEDSENPDGVNITVEGMADKGLSDANKGYVAPVLKGVKTLSDQFIGVASVFTGKAGGFIEEGYSAVQNIVGVYQAIDEGDTTKGVSNTLGLASKASDDLSILSSVGKTIEAQNALNEGKTEEANVKGIEAVGDGLGKIAEEMGSKGVGKAIEIVTSIPAAIHDLKDAGEEIKEISHQKENIEQARDKVVQLQDDKVQQLIQKREELLDMKNRYHFANMEQTDKVINSIKEKYPDLKDEIKQELRKDVSIIRKEWRNVIQNSGEGSLEKLNHYKSRKK